MKVEDGCHSGCCILPIASPTVEYTHYTKENMEVKIENVIYILVNTLYIFVHSEIHVRLYTYISI